MENDVEFAKAMKSKDEWPDVMETPDCGYGKNAPMHGSHIFGRYAGLIAAAIKDSKPKRSEAGAKDGDAID